MYRRTVGSYLIAVVVVLVFLALVVAIDRWTGNPVVGVALALAGVLVSLEALLLWARRHRPR